MSEEPSYSDPSPIFDSLDIDLVVKVLAHTAFSAFLSREQNAELTPHP